MVYLNDNFRYKYFYFNKFSILILILNHVSNFLNKYDYFYKTLFPFHVFVNIKFNQNKFNFQIT